LIFKKFEQVRLDPDPNLFGPCSALEPDPDKNGHKIKEYDPDPKSSVRIHNTADRNSLSFYGNELKRLCLCLCVGLSWSLEVLHRKQK